MLWAHWIQKVLLKQMRSEMGTDKHGSGTGEDEQAGQRHVGGKI